MKMGSGGITSVTGETNDLVFSYIKGSRFWKKFHFVTLSRQPKLFHHVVNFKTESMQMRINTYFSSRVCNVYAVAITSWSHPDARYITFLNRINGAFNFTMRGKVNTGVKVVWP